MLRQVTFGKVLSCLLRYYPAHGGVPMAVIFHAMAAEGFERAEVEATLLRMTDLGFVITQDAGVALDGDLMTTVTVTQKGIDLYDQLQGASPNG